MALIERLLDKSGATGLERAAAGEELAGLVEAAVAIECADAAELRAAVVEWGAAADAVDAGMDDSVSVEDFTARCLRLRSAGQALGRLAEEVEP